MEETLGESKQDNLDNPQPYIPPTADMELLEQSPVKPLGYNGMMVFFLDAKQQIIALPAEKLTQKNILFLFMPNDDFLFKAWPKYNKEGDKIGIDYDRVHQWLIRCCKEHKGVFKKEDVIRGVGCWEKDGILYMHCGDVVYTSDGETCDVGVIDDYVYPRDRSTIFKSSKNSFDANRQAIKKLEAALATWNWKRSIDAKLMLGWIATAIMGGALKWRPLVYVTAESGSGKSSLYRLIRSVLCEQAVLSSEQVSAAAIYQRLNNRSMPILLDEFESDLNTKKVQDILHLIRVAASGGTIDRGGAYHEATQFRIVSSVFMCGIIPPPLSSQEQNRIALFDLGELTHTEEPRFSDADIRIIGESIRGLILQQWPRWYDTVNAYTRLLKENDFDQRACDVYATLLAGYDILTQDDVPTQEALEVYREDMSAFNIEEVGEKTSNAESCLDVILQLQTEYHNHNIKETVYNVLSEFLGNPSNYEQQEKARTRLGTLGMTYVYQSIDGEDAKYYLVIPSNGLVLSHKLADTPWAGRVGKQGGWMVALKRLKGYCCKNIKIQGRAVRSACIPIADYVCAKEKEHYNGDNYEYE